MVDRILHSIEKLFRSNWTLAILIMIVILIAATLSSSARANSRVWERPCNMKCVQENINTLTSEAIDICCPDENSQLVLMSWNLKRFGDSKVSDPTILKTIVDVLSQADIIAIQEVTNAKGNALAVLEDKLDATGHDYSYIKSPLLGTMSYKEQYAYFYRTDKVYVKESYVLSPDGGIMNRPPFVAAFIFKDIELTLFNVHVQLDNVLNEVKILGQLIDTMKNVIVLGDLNFDCDYINEDVDIPLRDPDMYYWAISDDMDTNTTELTNCTYDRIILGYDVSPHLSYAEPFKYDDYFNHTNPSKVSDHWPVMCILEYR